jgi:Adenine-specific methyltransferase EcoRI
MANSNLTKAKNAKNDEFYTQYHDIEKEIGAYLDFNPDAFKDKTVLLPCDDPEWSNFTKFFAQNFERLKLKKLISTSYAPASKPYKNGYQTTMFEKNNPQFDEKKTNTNGKIFTLDHDTSGDGKIDVNDLEWTYLKGDGDFKSAEIKKLRDEADFIITNPPFSLFRDFLNWIMEADKQFVIIGNMNAITYKEVFPLIKNNKMWLGKTGNMSDMVFAVPKGTEIAEKDKEKAAKLGYIGDYTRLGNSCWYTNLDHGKRHQPLALMTYDDNLKFSKHKEIKENGYQKYDNYDAINVPFTDAIPSDYDGAMGVPISFLDKYSPEQFEIISANDIRINNTIPFKEHGLIKDKDGIINGVPTYVRLLIRHKKR